MNRTTLNLALAAVLSGLVGLVIYNQQAEQAKAEAAELKGPPLTALSRDTLNRIAILRSGQPEITLEKQDGHWRLTAPVAGRADDVEVDNLVAFAITPTRGLLDAGKLKRADLGLDPPAYTLRLNDTTIAVGGLEPIKYTRYVERDAGTPAAQIATIDDIGGSATDADWSDLVAKALLPGKAEIVRIEVPGRVVAKAADGPGWTLTPPAPEAGSDAPQQFVDAWRDAQALGLEPAQPLPPAKPGAKPEFASVTLADGSVQRYQILAREPQLILDYPPLKVRYRLGADQVDKLLALPAPKPEKAPETKPETKPEAGAGTPPSATAPAADAASAARP